MGLYTKIIDLQKLSNAWDKVRKNKPAAGVDQVTYEEFDARKGELLKELNAELQEHSYAALPVKIINLYKGDKVRKIALYCMRDKIVQQALARELNLIFDNLFSKQTYAYRENKSALIAIDEIHDAVTKMSYDLFLKIDIAHFFDNIRWDILERSLREYIREDDVLYLIKENSCSASFNEKTGELEKPNAGVYQGSGIAPILSNVYLMGFDKWLSGIKDVFFVRYSDDLLVLSKDRDQLLAILQEIVRRFEAIGLSVKDEKSRIGSVEEGFQFLGYAFDLNGKSIPQKAQDNLADRLELLWLTNGSLGLKEKFRKIMEIVGGWEQYFRGERKWGSVFEFAACLYSCGTNVAKIKTMAGDRWLFENLYRDLTAFFVDAWKEMGNEAWQVYEYEQYFGLPRSVRLEDEKTNRRLLEELNRKYASYIVRENSGDAMEIMQLYTDLGVYSTAEFWQKKQEELKSREANWNSELIRLPVNNLEVNVTKNTADKLLHLFSGREDIYARETLDSYGGRKKEIEYRPLTEKIITEHLSGKTTIDTYVQRTNSTIRYMVIDIDISKKIMLQYQRDSDEYRQYMQMTLDQASEITKIIKQWGMNSYIEYSGNRGYHVWVFFTEWIPTRYANMLCDALLTKIPKQEDVTLEFFPNKTRVLEGKKLGQVIKIPFGIHLKTGERSYFLDNAGMPVVNIDGMLDSIAKVSLGEVKRVVAIYSAKEEEKPRERTGVDEDLSAFGEIPSSVTEVLLKCPLMRYLCQKSVKTGYLGHFERLTILYVFGHLGSEGKKFVHKVMSFTLNYKFYVTDRFIQKCPEKPISCIKLRDQYKQVTAEIGCSCVFKRKENCYPSPVLHALSSGSELDAEVTLPTTRTLTKEKEVQVKENMNLHVKVQELAKTVLEYKKQKRAVDKMISKVEKELNEIFDDLKIDNMEIEMGLLTRKMLNGVTEWVIEL